MGDVTYHLLSEAKHLQGIDKIPIGILNLFYLYKK